MSDELLTAIYEKLKIFHDPVSKKALDHNNPDLKVIVKDGHANITINSDPSQKEKLEIKVLYY